MKFEAAKLSAKSGRSIRASSRWCSPVRYAQGLAEGRPIRLFGDGNLNYALEQLAELYYSADLYKKHIYLTGAYQFLVNPGYNKDRHGPVNIFSARLHLVV